MKNVKLIEFGFDKKCDFDLCQNSAYYALNIGAKGNILICQKCLTKLKQILKRSGEKNEEE